MIRTIASTDKLFVAALNGPAAGVGLAFVLACDVIIASERAMLVPAFGRLGLVPEVGTSWFLTRRLGYHGAIAYRLREEHIAATEALPARPRTRHAPHDELLARADAWCDRAARLPLTPWRGRSHSSRQLPTRPGGSLRLEVFAEANRYSTGALGTAAGSS